MTHNFLTLKKQILENEFSHLNDMQKTAVLTTNGPLLILAGAGSGKTTVLINRIVNILNFGNAYFSDTEKELDLNDQNILNEYIKTKDVMLKPEVSRILKDSTVRPYELLAITFTNKAAKELKERLEVACGETSNQIWANTFHATCTKILRRYGERLGYQGAFTIYDEDDKKKVLLEIVRSLNLDDKKYDPRVISSMISRSKDNLESVNDFKSEAAGNFFKETVATIYAAYEKRMFQSNALDFDDIISKTVRLLEQNDDILEYYQDKFKYILVDEYQDTNHAQYKLIYLLAKKHKNLCVVGDDDQSIYKFRGATITNILEFEKDYSNAKTIRLEQNYRSTSNILNSANGLISKNQKRKGKKLWTDKESKQKVNVYRCENQDDEAKYIANKILTGIANGKKFSDFAILYRNHALSNSIENALKRQAIPYRIFSGLRFFDRAEVRDMLAYLWVINNTNDTHRLRRIINVPARKIGAKAIETALSIAYEKDLTAYEVIKSAFNYPELSRPSTAFLNFAGIIEGLKKSLEYLPLDEFYDQVVIQTGYADMLLDKGDQESKTRLENVYELKSSIIEYMTRCEDTPTLAGFLEEISLFTDLDKADESSDVVTMLTIHSSKGLEFNSVFICGLEDGIFPSFKSLEDPNEVEEERRLAYVAITRAKENLTLSCTDRRLLYGQTKHYKPSIFLSEIPDEYTDSNISKGQMRMLNSERVASQNSHLSNKNTSVGFSVGTKKPTAPVSFDFKAGDVISHKVFGKGMIVSTKPMGGDLLLEIAFDASGTKRLLAKTAASFISKS